MGNPKENAKHERFFCFLTSPIQPTKPGCWDLTPQGVILFSKMFK